MTTQEKLDRLLKYLNELTAYQGAGVILDPAQAEKAQRVCEFANISELAFYVRSLDRQGLVDSHCAGDDTSVGATITIDGYSHLDTLPAYR